MKVKVKTRKGVSRFRRLGRNFSHKAVTMEVSPEELKVLEAESMLIVSTGGKKSAKKPDEKKPDGKKAEG